MQSWGSISTFERGSGQLHVVVVFFFLYLFSYCIHPGGVSMYNQGDVWMLESAMEDILVMFLMLCGYWSLQWLRIPFPLYSAGTALKVFSFLFFASGMAFPALNSPTWELIVYVVVHQ